MSPPPALPRHLQLEVTGSCNLRCRMCLVRYRPALNRFAARLDFERFRALVDALPDLEEITLQGLGEPLLAPDLFPMIAYASARGIATGFNTNATLLTRATAERLVDARLAWLCISLDGARAETYEGIRDGASFAKVTRNIAGLVDVVRARGATRPELSLVMVAMRRNIGELPAIVERAAAWGIPTVRVQNLSHSFSDTGGDVAYAAIRSFTSAEALWTDGDRGDVERTFAAAARRAETLGVTLRLPPLEEASPATRAVGAPGCDWPWRSAYVRHDGKVQPCCMLMGEDRGILGDLKNASFADIWAGDRYERFRDALLGASPPDVCRGCSMYRGVF